MNILKNWEILIKYTNDIYSLQIHIKTLSNKHYKFKLEINMHP